MTPTPALAAHNDKPVDSAVSAPRLSWSTNNEDYRFDDLDDLIEHEEPEVGQAVWFGERVELGTGWVNASDVIEQIADRAYDVGDEYAEGFPEVSAEAKAELDAFLRDWQAEHCKATFFTIRNARQYVITADDLARTTGAES